MAAARQTRELVENFFPPERRSQLSVKSLATSLEKFIGGVDLAARLDAFVELKEWSTSISPSPSGDGSTRLKPFWRSSSPRQNFASCSSSGAGNPD